MPLIPGRSKKALSKNIETEMDAGKPQKQSIAIAYSIQKKNKKKKMADGGEVAKPQQPVQSPPIEETETQKRMKQIRHAFNPTDEIINKAMGGEISASDEKRPMPDEEDHDKAMVGRNKGNKSSSNDDWGSNITVKQAQKPSPTKMSQPKLMGSDAFSVRNRDMHDDENDLGDRVYPESDRAQPNKRDDEEGPNRQGPDVPDMEKQHNNKRSAYEKASENQYSEDVADEDMKKVQSPLGRYADGGEVTADSITPEELDMIKKHRMASGGRVDMEPKDSGQELMERDDEMDMQDRLSPGSHGEQPKSAYDEIDADKMGEDMDHPASISEAVMRRRQMYADGGQVRLAQNAEEEPNNEDQMSYDALRKENYSESDGLDQLDSPMDSNLHGDDLSDEDSHDMVDVIRKKMKSKRGI